MSVMYAILGFSLFILFIIVKRMVEHFLWERLPKAWRIWFAEKKYKSFKKRKYLTMLQHLKDHASGNDLYNQGLVIIPLSHNLGILGVIRTLEVEDEEIGGQDVQKEVIACLETLVYRDNIHQYKIIGGLVDRVLISNLGETPNSDDALREVLAILKPRGILVVSDVIFNSHYITVAKVIKLVQSAGFDEIDVLNYRLGYSIECVKPNN